MHLRAVISTSLIIFFIANSNCVYGSVSMPSSETADSIPSPAKAPLVERYLIQGNLSAGESRLSARLQAQPHDDQARFGLGMLRFLQALERLGQDLYHFGFRIPVIDSPIPANPSPALLTYDQSRMIVERFIQGLDKTEGTLAQISDEQVNLPLHFGLIKLDLTSNGAPGDNQSLWKLYALFNPNRRITADGAKNFYIKFDMADIHWLRGYCHLIKAFLEILLAYDFRGSFNCCAGVFFSNVDSPYAILRKGEQEHDSALGNVFDLVALLHTIHWPLVEPQRMREALADFKAGIAQDKEMWKACMIETDDDHEWIPNPRQTGVIPGAKVTDAKVAVWMNMLQELEKILDGKKLVPFWRGDRTLGINVHKVFVDPPRNLDLVFWLQGSAAIPYLEKGTFTPTDSWRALQGAFGSELPGFALWFN